MSAGEPITTARELAEACEALLVEVTTWRANRQAYLDARSRECGFVFTERHLLLEQLQDQIENGPRGEPLPALRLIQGGEFAEASSLGADGA